MLKSFYNVELAKLVSKQIWNTFLYPVDVEPFLDLTIRRLDTCFQKYRNKHYSKDGNMIFSPYHSGQYSVFLYYLSNTIWRETNDENLCAVIYYLNKNLNSVDWYYEIELPNIFAVEHPLGSVMGRGKYSDHFLFYQGCTVGGSRKGGKINYPLLGNALTMYANSTILGNCNVGDNVVLSAGTQVINQDIPDNSLVFGSSPNLTIKARNALEVKEQFNIYWK